MKEEGRKNREVIVIITNAFSLRCELLFFSNFIANELSSTSFTGLLSDRSSHEVDIPTLPAIISDIHTREFNEMVF